MAVSAHDLPLRERRIERMGFRTTEHESTLIRRAADLRGLTVTQYVLCAVLDRAERDLYEHAARTQQEPPMPEGTVEPFHALANLFSA
jgi:uridine phosphorylase